MKTKLKAVHVHGVLWHDKANGNTYHSAQIYINGEYAYAVPFQYGYGESFIESAAEVLEEKGRIVRERYGYGGYPSLRKILTDMGVKFYYTSEVTSKKRAVRIGEEER
jgi:hypothetical protein